jgi:predicted RNA-binding Zn-ribbon protein involved in translation (DUF1610 family)
MTAWLDSKAVERFHADLDEIPLLFADLPPVLTGIKGEGSGVHQPPSSKPPLSMQIVSLLDTSLKDAAQWQETDPRGRDVLDRYGVIPRVGLWVRMTAEEMDDAGEQHTALDDWQTLGTLCGALKMYTGWLITQQWVTELAADMKALRSELEQATGVRKEFKPRCRWCHHLLEPQDGYSWFLCPACGADFTYQAEMRALLAVQDTTGPQVASLLGISWERIRQWKTRGLVTPTGRDSQRRDLFSIDAVAQVYRDISARRIVIDEGA